MAAEWLNVRQLEKAFGVSNMTLYLWRQGTPTKTALPYYQDGPRITFKLGEMKSWAKENGVAFDPKKLGTVAAPKPKTNGSSRNGKRSKAPAH